MSTYTLWLTAILSKIVGWASQKDAQPNLPGCVKLIFDLQLYRQMSKLLFIFIILLGVPRTLFALDLFVSEIISKARPGDIILFNNCEGILDPFYCSYATPLEFRVYTNSNILINI